MSTNLLNQTDAACTRIIRVARSLGSLSDALHTIGNETLSRQLDDLRVDLDQSVKEVKDAVSDKILVDVREAEQASRNMLGAALSGTQLSKPPAS